MPKPLPTPRRTLIQAEKKAVLEVKVAGRAGHGGGQPEGLGARPHRPRPRGRQLSPSRPVTACMARLSAARVDTLLVFGCNGRVYSVPVAVLPGGAW